MKLAAFTAFAALYLHALQFTGFVLLYHGYVRKIISSGFVIRSCSEWACVVKGVRSVDRFPYGCVHESLKHLCTE